MQNNSTVLTSGIENFKNREPLTDAENRVYKLLVKGEAVDEIAIKLELSPKTVKFHSYRIYRKLNVKNKLELVYTGQMEALKRADLDRMQNWRSSNVQLAEAVQVEIDKFTAQVATTHRTTADISKAWINVADKAGFGPGSKIYEGLLTILLEELKLT